MSANNSYRLLKLSSLLDGVSTIFASCRFSARKSKSNGFYGIIVREVVNSNIEEEFTIRQFKLVDLDKVHEIECKSFSDPWPKFYFKYLYYRSPEGFLVAVKGKEIIGYVIAEIVRRLDVRGFRLERRGHIINLAVDDRFRRRGIGTTLVKSIIDRLRNKKVKNIWLEVRVSNIAARRLYSKLGFEERGRIYRYYFDEDAVLMVKEF